MVKTPPCSDKLQMQKGIWNDDGDRERNAAYVPKQDGTGNWTTFSKRSGSGPKRSGKNSREKWHNGNNSKCDPKHKSFTTQEEELVIQLHSAIGSRWPIIAQQLPGRTDNDVKTLWNSKLRKKLSAMGIDPVTHKPFSQILADYGNIGAFPKARTRFSSLSKDIKNSIVFKSSNSELISQNPNNNNNNNNINPHENFSHYFHDHLFSPSPSNISDIAHYNNNNNPLDLYSQLQSVNFVTKKPDNNNNNLNLAQQQQQQLFVNNECATSSSVNQEFSWSDFFLEDAQLENEGNILVAHECGGGGEKLESEEDQVKERYIINEDNNNEINALVDNNNNNTFEALSSPSNSASSFVEAMIESQDEMFSQLPCFYEEQFY
ncbi:hypothetical protein ABFX02_09G031900 [Erythranthe guttata]